MERHRAGDRRGPHESVVNRGTPAVEREVMSSMASFRFVEENLRHSLALYACVKECGEARDIDGVSIVSSGVDFSMFNPALLSAPVFGERSELERRLHIPAAHFTRRGLRWSYWLCTDMVDRPLRRWVEHVFDRGGLRQVSSAPGMIADGIKTSRRALPDLAFRRVCDAATRNDFSTVTALGFGLPRTATREIYNSERFWNGRFYGFVGYSDGVPVTTAATMVAAGSIGLYSVATLPARRGRGYAEAAVRHAIEEARARTGLTRTVLQSTPSGFPLYERMGFRHVTDFFVYVSD